MRKLSGNFFLGKWVTGITLMYSFGTHGLSSFTRHVAFTLFWQAIAMPVPHSPHQSVTRPTITASKYHSCPPAPPLFHTFTTFLQALVPSCLADSPSLLILTGSGLLVLPTFHMPDRGVFLKHRSDYAQGCWAPYKRSLWLSQKVQAPGLYTQGHGWACSSPLPHGRLPPHACMLRNARHILLNLLLCLSCGPSLYHSLKVETMPEPTLYS